MSNAQIILKKGKYDSVLRKHPWVFSGAIKEIIGDPVEGDVVNVVGGKGEFLGKGHFQNATIAVRMLTYIKEEIDNDFFKNRILNAINYRTLIGYSFDSLVNNSWRLVFSEADQLSGLIIDYYNGVAVIQTHSIGFHRIAKNISDIIVEILKDKLIAVVFKSKIVSSSISGENNITELLWGDLPQKLIITENNCKFIVDVIRGQKTGFFIDQSVNRELLSKISKDKKVLNLFGYSGGFSVSALNGGARLVHTVDASKSAIELAKDNLTLNNYDLSINECFVSDSVDFMENQVMDYDIIILDPPAYAKHNDARHRAVKGYQRLNAIAIQKIMKSSFLLTFSCSQVVDKKLFESTVMSAAIIAGRHVRVVQELTHAPCHANAISHPEGKYLKGLLLFVE